MSGLGSWRVQSHQPRFAPVHRRVICRDDGGCFLLAVDLLKIKTDGGKPLKMPNRGTESCSSSCLDSQLITYARKQEINNGN